MRKIFVHDFTYFNAVLWKRISTLHLLLFMIDLLNLNEIQIWLQIWQWFGRKQRKHMASTYCGNDLTAGKIQGVFLTQPAPSGVMMWPGEGAICSSRTEPFHCWTPYSYYSTYHTILHYSDPSTVSSVGFNTGELDIDEVKIKMAVGSL